MAYTKISPFKNAVWKRNTLPFKSTKITRVLHCYKNVLFQI